MCDTVALDDSNINTTHPVRLDKHQAADQVPKPGPHQQGQMDKKPDYIYQHIGDMQGRNTRQEAERVGNNLLRDVRNMEKETAKRTFIPCTI